MTRDPLTKVQIVTWTAPSKKRSRRPVWLTAALLVILMLATPLAAHAGKSSYDDSGPAMKHGTTGAGDKGGKHPNFKCGENIGKRPGVLYHFTSGSWQVHYEGRYPNCLNKFWRRFGADPIPRADAPGPDYLPDRRE